MKNTQRDVRRFRRQFRLWGAPTLSKLKKVIPMLSYTLLPYEGNENLIKQLVMDTPIEQHPAITISKGKNKYIFYDDKNLAPDDVPYILAHEIAHIYLNHFKRNNGYNDTYEYKEHEANDFASALTQSPFDKTKLTILCLSILSAALLIINFMPNKQPAPQHESTPPTSELQQQEKTLNNINTDASSLCYVITPTGDKYHISTCYHISNSKTIPITKQDAQAAGYTPCKTCRPDTYEEPSE